MTGMTALRTAARTYSYRSVIRHLNSSRTKIGEKCKLQFDKNACVSQLSSVLSEGADLPGSSLLHGDAMAPFNPSDLKAKLTAKDCNHDPLHEMEDVRVVSPWQPVAARGSRRILEATRIVAVGKKATASRERT